MIINKINDTFDNGFYAYLTVDNIQIECLIDNGSTSSILSSKIFELNKSSKILDLVNHTVTDVNGRQLNISGIANFIIQFECCLVYNATLILNVYLGKTFCVVM